MALLDLSVVAAIVHILDAIEKVAQDHKLETGI